MPACTESGRSGSSNTAESTTRGAGATPVQIPLTADLKHDLPAMLDAITDKTRVIFVCTPNNPTGTVVGHGELRDFLAQVPERILVEFSSPNTNKPLHLGHIRNILLGWSTYKILSACGHDVRRGPARGAASA